MLGFVVDSVVFSVIHCYSEQAFIARVIGFFCALQTTWLGNRRMTFNDVVLQAPFKQWCKYVTIAMFSGALNIAIFMLVKTQMPIPAAFCLGILVGLFSNYFFVNRLVFIQQWKDNC